MNVTSEAREEISNLPAEQDWLSSFRIKDTYQGLVELDRLECKSLAFYVTEAWKIIEPGRTYLPNWHIDCMADHCEAITRGELTRLLINIPPGTMKSLFVNVFWPSWEWGPMGLQHKRHIGISHTQELALRDNTKFRRLVSSRWFQDRWPCPLSTDTNNKIKIENVKYGFRQAAPTISITGARGDAIVLDDPHNVTEAESEKVREDIRRWFQEALQSRLVDPDSSAILVIMQRLHARDISGLILSDDFGYEHLCLPMEYESDRTAYTKIRPTWYDAGPRKRYGKIFGRLETILDPHDSRPNIHWYEGFRQDPRTDLGELLFPSRFPRHVVDNDKRTWGTYAAAGQLQQRPAPREGGIFKMSWFKQRLTRVAAVEIPVRKILWRFDLGATEDGDPTVGVRMGERTDGDGYIIYDVALWQLGPGATRARILKIMSKEDRRVRIVLPQDPGQAGKSQKFDYASLLAEFDVRFERETKNKELRAEPFGAQAEAGRIWLVDAVWVEPFLEELATFPNGEHDDQVDAVSGAYNNIVRWTTIDPDIAAPRYVTANATVDRL